MASIAAGSGVTEGGNTSPTLTASPAPASPLSVSVTVAQSGDYATSGSPTYTVTTVDEPPGSVTVTLATGQGYTVRSASTATMAVADNDDVLWICWDSSTALPFYSQNLPAFLR